MLEKYFSTARTVITGRSTTLVGVAGGHQLQHFSFPPRQWLLRHAEVSVEERRCEALLALGQAELHTKPLEPFASIVGDEALQGYEVDEMPRVIRGLEQLPSLIGDFPRSVDITGEVRQVPLRAQDRAVRGVTFLGKPSERVSAGRSPAHPGARANGSHGSMLGSACDGIRILVRLDRFGVAQGKQQVATAGSRRADRGSGVVPNCIDQAESVSVGPSAPAVSTARTA